MEQSIPNNTCITIIGSGNMGTSIAEGLIAQHYPADKIWMSDPDTKKLNAIKQKLKLHTLSDNQTAASVAHVVILAVKPQILSAVILEIAPIIQKNKPLIISIAAGIRESHLQKKLGGNIAIVRAMPNTPALIGCGASALFANTYVSPEQQQLAESILKAVGIAIWVENEPMLDIVTALSGSGPAYFFLVMETLQTAAEALGLPADIARKLTLQTALGAARLAMESEKTVSELRQNVTSPGGTTEKALSVLEKANIRQLFSSALEAAKNHSEKLAQIE